MNKTGAADPADSHDEIGKWVRYMILENDVVCFLGDSITDTGLWIRRVYDYYRNTLGIKCEMYNCGVSGDTADHAYHRLEETVFIYKPTVVVIEFGINDIKGDLYDARVLDEECVKKRRFALDDCIASIRKLADVFTERGIRMIFCTPTRYNELLECDTPVRIGMMGALEEVSGRIRGLAEEYGATLVDFNETLRKIMKQMYKEGSSMTVADRVHPNEQGAELLARIFLKAQGFDMEISEDIESLRGLAGMPHDAWETKRYELDLKARAGHFVRWCLFYCEKNDENILRGVEEKLKEVVENQDNPWMENQLRQYLRYYKDIPEYQKELIEHTKTVSDVLCGGSGT